MAPSGAGRSLSVGVLVGVLGILLAAGHAAAGKDDESRALREKATAAFALGHYAAAAEDFEKAFELAPEPALLYNAAQAHRLAGNKERALTLYQNYSRIYGKREKRAEVEARIEELTQAIERDKAVANRPPATLEPVAGGGAGGAAGGSGGAGGASAADSAGAGGSAALVLVTQPAVKGERDQRESIARKPWFWGAVGGGVAVVVTIVLVLTLSGSRDPSASLGTVHGN